MELKVCPFCGKMPSWEPHFAHGGLELFHDCEKQGVTIHDEKEWNSAYCWLEIDRLIAQVEELNKEVSTWKTISETHGETLKETEDELSEAMKLIERLAAHTTQFHHCEIPLLKEIESFLKGKP